MEVTCFHHFLARLFCCALAAMLGVQCVAATSLPLPAIAAPLPTDSCSASTDCSCIHVEVDGDDMDLGDVCMSTLVAAAPVAAGDLLSTTRRGHVTRTLLARAGRVSKAACDRFLLNAELRRMPSLTPHVCESSVHANLFTTAFALFSDTAGIEVSNFRHLRALAATFGAPYSNVSASDGRLRAGVARRWGKGLLDLTSAELASVVRVSGDGQGECQENAANATRDRLQKNGAFAVHDEAVGVMTAIRELSASTSGGVILSAISANGGAPASPSAPPSTPPPTFVLASWMLMSRAVQDHWLDAALRLRLKLVVVCATLSSLVGGKPPPPRQTGDRDTDCFMVTHDDVEMKGTASEFWGVPIDGTTWAKFPAAQTQTECSSACLARAQCMVFSWHGNHSPATLDGSGCSLYSDTNDDFNTPLDRRTMAGVTSGVKACRTNRAAADDGGADGGLQKDAAAQCIGPARLRLAQSSPWSSVRIWHLPKPSEDRAAVVADAHAFVTVAMAEQKRSVSKRNVIWYDSYDDGHGGTGGGGGDSGTLSTMLFGDDPAAPVSPSLRQFGPHALAWSSVVKASAAVAVPKLPVRAATRCTTLARLNAIGRLGDGAARPLRSFVRVRPAAKVDSRGNLVSLAPRAGNNTSRKARNMEEVRVTSPRTPPRRTIAFQDAHDCAFTVAVGGQIQVALEIERVTGVRYYQCMHESAARYDAVWQTSLGAAAAQTGLPLRSEPFDVAVIVGNVMRTRLALYRQVEAKRWLYVPHHRAHSLHAFVDSPFRVALVLSYDGAGDDGHFNVYHAWRDESGEAVDLKLLGQFGAVGDTYTRFGLMFKEIVGAREQQFEQQRAQKAASPRIEDVEVGTVYPCDFKTCEGSLHVPGRLMGYSATGKVRADWIPRVRQLYHGLEDKGEFEQLSLTARFPVSEFDHFDNDPEVQRDFAATVQHTLEMIVEDRLRGYVDALPHIEGIVIGGGCGLNIKVNAHVQRIFGLPVWTTSAPNDAGITVGGAWAVDPPRRDDWQPLHFTGLHAAERDWLPVAAARFGAMRPSVEEVADLVARGAIIGIVRGRQEFGPRALGHRSLIASPDKADMRERLNRLKRREWCVLVL